MTHRYETFTVLIAKISRNIRKIKNQEMAAYDLRSVHISCLYYLYSTEGLTATDLCERCQEDKATISRALAYLERHEYVTRQPEIERRYKSPIALTEKGFTVGREIAEKVERVLSSVGAGLTEEERIAFYRSLAIISDDLEAAVNNTKNEEKEP